MLVHRTGREVTRKWNELRIGSNRCGTGGGSRCSTIGMYDVGESVTDVDHESTTPILRFVVSHDVDSDRWAVCRSRYVPSPSIAIAVDPSSIRSIRYDECVRMHQRFRSPRRSSFIPNDYKTLPRSHSADSDTLKRSLRRIDRNRIRRSFANGRKRGALD